MGSEQLKTFPTGHDHLRETIRLDQRKIQLTALGKGEHAFVAELSGGRTVSNRLVSLGFTPGVEVDMVQNYGHGPLIVSVRGTRVALGRGEAAKILVRKEGA